LEDVNMTSVTLFNGTFVFGGIGFGCSKEILLRRVYIYWESSGMDFTQVSL
jgi:hypothetical protein